MVGAKVGCRCQGLGCLVGGGHAGPGEEEPFRNKIWGLSKERFGANTEDRVIGEERKRIQGDVAVAVTSLVEMEFIERSE